jgi:hypothetical protein
MTKRNWKTWLRAQTRSANGEGVRGWPTEIARTLEAIAHCWELYAASDRAGQGAALAAVRALLPAMQLKCRPLARELIAFALDWSDRERLWAEVCTHDRVLLRDTDRVCEGCGATYPAGAALPKSGPLPKAGQLIA